MQSTKEQSKDRITEQYLNAIGVPSKDREKAKQLLSSYTYTEIAKPLVIADYATGNHSWESLSIKYRLTISVVRRLLKQTSYHYYKNKAKAKSNSRSIQA